ncbi:bacillithiol system redox-active protein YtxJ [Tenacibaculum finnmarkense genomovar ulcerans]|uniref:bacillithiol system redox-active protein YtxJ n=1 Tax=Tenacibaculum finnmarkense TaxID=2781243 RepID=UPI00187B6020|nr:bacillithiol system redox-active protein YtxJ [Tenacibaculum finnmarkense]MBE7634354.1 bacillithiol system redox-active protein YtxJ [Tenacibaculum finnmarkense genomovar ulcerans]MCD8430677.1 bacillithiol system redox-active protein YtxJ [Tenacibaculum finnmarkense genomovar ulcerans]
MGILNTIFGSTKDTNNSEDKIFINWIPLIALSQLEDIKKQSQKEPIAIFKHSTRCSISSVAKSRFEKSFDESLKDFKVYYLDLISYREISNEIGIQFQVEHQSPQLLIIQKEAVVAHASHYEIAQIDLTKF